jgi:plasmid stabilization system protein ParE
VGYQIITKKRFVQDLLNVHLYLEQEWGRRVADEFQDKIYLAFSLLQTHPYIGAPSLKTKGARALSITKHNRLYYRVESNKIIIIFLADTSRKNYKI